MGYTNRLGQTIRYEMWCGSGLPKGWAEAMGIEYDGDTVWPIVDSETCGPIDGTPRPDQMLCWAPSSEKQVILFKILNGLEDEK